MKNEKIKENAWFEFSKIIENSWTFNRMTKEEKETWDHVIRSEQAKNNIKGTYQQRMEALSFVYSAFLAGLGYNGFNWREKENTPNF